MNALSFYFKVVGEPLKRLLRARLLVCSNGFSRCTDR